MAGNVSADQQGRSYCVLFPPLHWGIGAAGDFLYFEHMNSAASTTRRPTWIRSTVTSLSRQVIILSMSLLVIGCAGVRVEHLTDETYAPRRAVDQIEWLNQEPARPHVELARIVVRSTNLSQESLRSALLDRAYSLGADALVSEVPLDIAMQAGSPYYEPGLLGPSGAAFGLYGYGWYTPYSSNPYILTQGATDQPRIDHVLSAIAIRYQ